MNGTHKPGQFLTLQSRQSPQSTLGRDESMEGVPSASGSSRPAADAFALNAFLLLQLTKPNWSTDVFAGKTALLLTVTGLAFAAGFTVAQTTHGTGREPQFENADVKVWKSVVLPNDPLPLHRHEHPRVIVALHGGTMKILEESGQSELNKWQTGKAYWLPANPPGTRHQDVNVGNEPIEVMVVELQNEK